jgi:hypothetical protein
MLHDRASVLSTALSAVLLCELVENRAEGLLARFSCDLTPTDLASDAALVAWCGEEVARDPDLLPTVRRVLSVFREEFLTRHAGRSGLEDQ